jgi:5-hydroxyisourate hydrolase
MSQITTHILDTSKGKPAQGVKIYLYHGSVDKWVEMANGITNTDGRVPDLLKKDVLLKHGTYKLRFDVNDYFERDGITAFYPFVEIVFYITADEHYHVPLLLNPFGYSTYRGS